MLEVCDYGLQLFDCMVVEIATPNMEEVSMDFSCSDFFSGGFMSRFSDNGTDSGSLRLLKLLRIEKNVFTVYRRTRKVIRSVHVVVAVEKNGMKLYVDAYCVAIEPVSFVTCVERFYPFLKYFKWLTSTFFTSP